MRIAEIATLGRPVPPTGEGSVELLVSLLTEELVRRGHEVTLFALPMSRTSARLVSPVKLSYTEGADAWDWQVYESYQVREAFMRWREFDIIHCHSYHFGMLYCDFVPTPSLHSFHIEPGPDYLFLARNTVNRHLHFCSRHQARDFAGVGNTHVVPHGLDLSICRPSLPVAERENYLAFLGRFIPGKGVDMAIRMAKETGFPLKLAGPENDYFRERVRPHLSPGLIEYAGEVAGQEKVDFLARAHALVYPILDGEPFGLVLVEAMACGTPVIALGCGAVPEIIDHGVTGWIAESYDGMIRGMDEVRALDPVRIIHEANSRFTHQRMTDGIERIMKLIVEEGGAP